MPSIITILSNMTARRGIVQPVSVVANSNQQHHPPRTFGEAHTAIQDTTQTADGKTPRSWQAIAREVTQEQDPVKVRKLSAELNQAMLDEERLKVRLRLGY